MARTTIQLEASSPTQRRDLTDAVAPTVVVTEVSDEPVSRSNLRREISALSESIIRIINSGSWSTLSPNSGDSVEVGEHQVCVSYDEDMNSGYRTWEWQGHILVYDEEEQRYVPEYVYGNHFEPLLKMESPYEGFLHQPSPGLTGIINRIESRQRRSN